MTITRQKRFTVNSDPIVAYFRDATDRVVYRYADIAPDAPIWLYEGTTDKPIEKFSNLDWLELGVLQLAL